MLDIRTVNEKDNALSKLYDYCTDILDLGYGDELDRYRAVVVRDEALKGQLRLRKELVNEIFDLMS